MSTQPPLQSSSSPVPPRLPDSHPLPSRRRTLAWLAVLILVSLGAWKVLGWWQRQRLANDTFGNAIAHLNHTSAPPDYDINDAIRLIYLVDHSLTQEGAQLRPFLTALESLDTSRIPKELLDAKRQLVEQLKQIYLIATSIEDRERMWEDHTKVFRSLISMVDPLTGTFNTSEAGKFLDQHRQHARELAEMGGALRELELHLGQATVEYLKVFNKYYRVWDQFCLIRDQAYLAADRQDWKLMYEASREAMKQQPHDRESMLLAAWALVEKARAVGAASSPKNGAQESSPSSESALAEAETLISAYMNLYPSQASPALVLRGVIQAQRGQNDQARLSWEQASAVYHQSRRAPGGNRLADTYTLRSSLRKSASGIRITTLYRSMTDGAGYFSPELWLSKMTAQAGVMASPGTSTDPTGQVMDHFTRRVADIADSTQVRLENPSKAGGVAEWLLKWAVGEEKAKQMVRTASLEPVHDYLLSDIQFCLRNPWPGARCLEVESPYVLKPVVESRNDNRIGFRIEPSPAEGTNAVPALEAGTLLVCMQFTGMQANDYEVFMIPEVPQPNSDRRTWSTASVALRYRLFNREMLPRDVVRVQGVYVTPKRVLVLAQAPDSGKSTTQSRGDKDFR